MNVKLIYYLDHEKIVEMLVDKGAGLNQRRKTGGTALCAAIYGGNSYL